MKTVKEVDLIKLKEMSIELAQTVRRSGYKPEHILYIERAGLLVGFEIADFFQCGISGITSRRSGSSIKSKFKRILRHLPRVITHFLRQFELNSNIHGIHKERNVFCEYQFPPKDKKLLIVDDAIDTGYSLAAIRNFLETHGYDKNSIKIAVLTTTGAAPVLHADFSLLDQVTCAFPWSYDSRQYEETWEIYRNKKGKLAS